MKTKPQPQWQQKLIDAYKFVFKKYPNLNALPVYIWGRFYVYELAGEPCEVSITDNVCGIGDLILYTIKYKLNKKLLQKIHNDVLKDDKLFDAFDSISDSIIKRKNVVSFYNFDDRGARCLIIEKKGTKFKLIDVESDTNE